MWWHFKATCGGKGKDRPPVNEIEQARSQWEPWHHQSKSAPPQASAPVLEGRGPVASGTALPAPCLPSGPPPKLWRKTGFTAGLHSSFVASGKAAPLCQGTLIRDQGLTERAKVALKLADLACYTRTPCLLYWLAPINNPAGLAVTRQGWPGDCGRRH